MDLDGDGHLDILSGSWPGELFLFRGGPGQAFSAPEMIKDREGQIINIGGGIRDEGSGRILITGHGQFEQTDEGTFVNYHGQRLKSTPQRPISITGTASAVHAVDWDGDGDYDLLVGDIGGNVYLIPNEGSPREYAFAKEQQLVAASGPVRVAGDAGPFAADWDGDGDLDLLVGAGDGSVMLFQNVGTATAPQLAAGELLVPPAEVTYGPDAPSQPQRGVRSKVCAADWNGDGRLDLLVGDFTTQKPDRPEPTPEQQAEHERIRGELQPLRARFSQLVSKLYGASPPAEEEHGQLQEELKETSGRVQELQAQLPPEYETHGWVWLFLRK